MLSVLTWVLDLQVWVAHVSIENRWDCSQVSKRLVCLPFLDIALVVRQTLSSLVCSEQWRTNTHVMIRGGTKVASGRALWPKTTINSTPQHVNNTLKHAQTLTWQILLMSRATARRIQLHSGEMQINTDLMNFCTWRSCDLWIQH